MRLKRKIIEITPLICLIVYLALGFFLNIWHPTWVIFFLCFIVPAILSNKISKIVCAVWPILCVVAYIIIGVTTNLWHPFWIIFITIPIVEILFRDVEFSKKKKIDVIDES